ncbi:MAG: branched-chain amino acid ABC transporter permease [Alphaproteobacteria bacterium]|nr:branched-chain amino acid ABC transporter permease [Alphaproteobacteria bacterium]
MKLGSFWLWAAVIALVGAALTILDIVEVNTFVYFAGYVVLQYVVLATAWNIMGGYMGYVNFGTAGFFAVGAYTSVVLYNLFKAPLLVMIPVSGLVCALLGLAMGYLTLRLRGVFFAIATLALAIVLETLVINWDYVGGATGAYILRAREIAPFGDYIEFLFFVMLLLAIFAVGVARWIERSKVGRGFAAIRDDEEAAECAGVPTLRLKLVATTISGFLMGVAGAPFVLYVGFVEPSSAFNLVYAVNSIAMPMIGGATTWLGPLIGALLLGTVQQVATVTISSELNLLIVGVLLVFFVIAAPEGIVGLVRKWRRSGNGR